MAPKIKIHGQKLVHRSPSHYCAFPWAVVLPGKSLALVFRRAGAFSRDAAKSGAATHHHLDSEIVFTLSHDEGEKWSRPEKIYSSAHGVNDPALSILSNGELLLRIAEIGVVSRKDRSKLKGRMVAHRVEHGLISSVAGNVVARLSYDKKAKKLRKKSQAKVSAGDLTFSCSREPVTLLPDGSWLLPVYAGAPFQTDSSYLLRSYDTGRTWIDSAVIAKDHENFSKGDQQGNNYNETSILFWPNGDMLAAVRTDSTFYSDDGFIPVGGVGTLSFCHSNNWGLSWSKPAKSSLFGQPAHLLHWGEDGVICTFGQRKRPYCIKIAFSKDRGRTWEESELPLSPVGDSWDLGYPMTVALGSGEFLSFYYMTDAENIRGIYSTKWSIA